VIKSEAHTFEQNPKSALGWITDRPYMIFGADVTHPAPGSSAPSVAAVVGSLNKSATRFAARILLQVRAESNTCSVAPIAPSTNQVVS
jgi:hypothetical protein